jgi:UDP-glucose 4-epimerase
MDVNDTKSLNELFAKNNFFAVLHLAAMKAVGESSTIPLDYYSTNVNGSLNILKV